MVSAVITMNTICSHILAMLLLVHQFISIAHSQHCPIGCDPCFNEAIVCRNQILPLKELPTEIGLTVRKLTFTKQNFNNPTLMSENFTNFAPPHISLKELSIRQCQVKFIAIRAFSPLTKLDSLDLSNNRNLSIADDSFHGLGLRTLLLNNMKSLHLTSHSFRGLKVTSLSIIDSGLTSISYVLLHPLSRSLSKLFLQKNLISTIEPRVSLVFDNLVTLDLTDNPLHCDCQLQWLVRFYKSHINNSSTLISPQFPKSHPLVPSCTQPPHLLNRQLTRVNMAEIVCDVPQITELNLQLDTKVYPAELVCTGHHKAWLAPLEISWFNVASKDNQRKMLSQTFKNEKSVSQTLRITNISDLGRYKCFLNNSIGTTSASVSINWPEFISRNQNYLEQQKLANNGKLNKNRSWKDTFFERRFTLLEILAAIIGTVLFTGMLFLIMHKLVFINCFNDEVGSNNNFWWMNRKKKISDKSNNLSQPQMAPSLSLTSTNCDAPVYSNHSQTYDQPGLTYTGSTLFLPTTASSLLPQNSNKVTNIHPQSVPSTHTLPTQHQQPQPQPQPQPHYLDFKTQRKIYQKL